METTMCTLTPPSYHMTINGSFLEKTCVLVSMSLQIYLHIMVITIVQFQTRCSTEMQIVVVMP